MGLNCRRQPKHTTIRIGAVMFVMLLLAGCAGPGPGSPTRRIDGTTPPPANSPQPSGPSRIFAFDHPLSYSVSEYTKRSRFDLYDNGAFVLEFPICSCPGAYRGTYKNANGILTFEWEGWSVAGPWSASGTLRGDTLTVTYNTVMQLSDFEDAVYRLIE